MTEGNGRIHLLDHKPPLKPATDAKGRPLHRAATVEAVYQIVAEETAKVHEYYLNQIPPFVARMIQDALMSYGLVQVAPGTTDIAPSPTVCSESTGHYFVQPATPESRCQCDALGYWDEPMDDAGQLKRGPKWQSGPAEVKPLDAEVIAAPVPPVPQSER